MKSKFIQDDRNIQRIDPSPDMVGEIYQPWYFFKTQQISSPKNIEQACLIYKMERLSLDPNETPATSFLKIPSKEHKKEYLNPQLVESIKREGQQSAIICTKHYTSDAPVNVGFLEDPKLEKIHVFEGHHRVIATSELKIPVIADVYYFYHMDLPINYNKYFNSSYDNSFWSPFQQPQHRSPWFSEENFLNLSTTYKSNHLDSCFKEILSKNLNLNNGIDIGCAEGAYSVHASEKLNIPILGIDSEPGRIIRGQLMRHKHQFNTKFMVSDWLKFKNYDSYDFAMLLSILHHVNAGEEESFLENVLNNKKAAIIEVRISEQDRIIKSGSIKQIRTRSFYEALFSKLGFTYNFSSIKDDRAFYCIYKK